MKNEINSIREDHIDTSIGVLFCPRNNNVGERNDNN